MPMRSRIKSPTPPFTLTPTVTEAWKPCTSQTATTTTTGLVHLTPSAVSDQNPPRGRASLMARSITQQLLAVVRSHRSGALPKLTRARNHTQCIPRYLARRLAWAAKTPREQAHTEARGSLPDPAPVTGMLRAVVPTVPQQLGFRTHRPQTPGFLSTLFTRRAPPRSLAEP
jgi:hypothetical protein